MHQQTTFWNDARLASIYIFFCIINTKWIFRNGRGKKEKFLLRCFATSIGASIQRLIRAHLHFIYAFFFHYFIHLNLRIWKNRRNIYNYTLARAVSHTKKTETYSGRLHCYVHILQCTRQHSHICSAHRTIQQKCAHMFLIPICSSAGWLLRMFSDVYEVSTPFAVCVCVYSVVHTAFVRKSAHTAISTSNADPKHIYIVCIQRLNTYRTCILRSHVITHKMYAE